MAPVEDILQSMLSWEIQWGNSLKGKTENALNRWWVNWILKEKQILSNKGVGPEWVTGVEKSIPAKEIACTKVLWPEREQWKVTEVLRNNQTEDRVEWRRNLIRFVFIRPCWLNMKNDWKEQGRMQTKQWVDYCSGLEKMLPTWYGCGNTNRTKEPVLR